MSRVQRWGWSSVPRPRVQSPGTREDEEAGSLKRTSPKQSQEGMRGSLALPASCLLPLHPRTHPLFLTPLGEPKSPLLLSDPARLLSACGRPLRGPLGLHPAHPRSVPAGGSHHMLRLCAGRLEGCGSAREGRPGQEQGRGFTDYVARSHFRAPLLCLCFSSPPSISVPVTVHLCLSCATVRGCHGAPRKRTPPGHQPWELFQSQAEVCLPLTSLQGKIPALPFPVLSTPVYTPTAFQRV